MRYYIIAGEASGDLHGSGLIRELKKLDAAAIIRCWGGDKMRDAGGELIKHYRELAFMGFAEVVKNLPTIMRNLAFCKKDILGFHPDALILIDYPGFNLRIAKWAKHEKSFIQFGCKLIYYISPQVWAWKENRVKEMKKNIDKMIVILPFEKEYFRSKWDWDVEYVGHPLMEVIENEKNKLKELGPDFSFLNQSGKKPVIALLPGSRKQEIKKKLPIMLEVTKQFPDCHFVIAQAPSVDDGFYSSISKDYPNVSSVRNQTYDLLGLANAAIVTSGTATLETALFEVPEVVVYKTSFITYEIAKRLVKIDFIAMVNLIMGRLVVKELIQKDLSPENLQKELKGLLYDEEKIETIKAGYRELKRLLFQNGNASTNAARIIVETSNK